MLDMCVVVGVVDVFVAVYVLDMCVALGVLDVCVVVGVILRPSSAIRFSHPCVTSFMT